MKYIQLTLKQNIYFPEIYNDDSMLLLSKFLTDDSGCSGSDRWINWLRSTNETARGGNYTWLEKEEGNIIMSSQYTDDPYEWTFESTIDDLVYILQEWQKLCSVKKREIIITRENGKLKVEGID